MNSYAFRSNGLLALIVLSAFGTAYQGCSSDDAGEPPAGVGVGSDASADSAAGDAGIDATTDQGGTVEASTDTGPVIVDAPTDTGDALDASFDCDADIDSEGLPNNLRCTGLYSDWATKTVTSDVRPFSPGYALWSDGALKSRFIYLPPGSTIDNANLDEWTFPIGTKTWKEFRLGTQRIETRFFHKTGATTWVFAVYRWSADEQTATRLDGGETNVNGTPYEIPTKAQCMLCHQGRNDRVLGFDAVSLGASTASGTTLQTLVTQNLLTVAMAQTLEIPQDSTNIARAPFGWLHANCGASCHNKNIAALASGTGLHLRISATHLVAEAGTVRLSDLDPYKTSVGVTPNLTFFSSQGFQRIFPGNPDKSQIPTMALSRDGGVPQMPPIVSHAPPSIDVAALRNWISAMPTDGGT